MRLNWYDQVEAFKRQFKNDSCLKLRCIGRSILRQICTDQVFDQQETSVPSKQEASLIAIYQKMETAEIKRRVKAGQLTQMAQDIAKQELQRRVDRKIPASSNSKYVPKNPIQVVLSLIAGGGLVIAFAYWRMPGYLPLVLMAVLPIFGAIFGKIFPKFGSLLAWLLLLTPIWLTAWMWSEGALTMKYGDYRPLEAIIAYVLLFFLSVFGIAIGASMLKGARHKGSWEDLEDALEAQQKDALNGIK